MVGIIWLICEVIVYGFEIAAVIFAAATVICMAKHISGESLIDWLIR